MSIKITRCSTCSLVADDESLTRVEFNLWPYCKALSVLLFMLESTLESGRFNQPYGASDYREPSPSSSDLFVGSVLLSKHFCKECLDSHVVTPYTLGIRARAFRSLIV